MKTDTIQTRNRITTCLIALLTFCLVLTGIFFIAPIEAEAAVNDTFTVDNITYRVLTEEEGNYTVEVLDEALTEETAVTIPATVSNGTHTYSVTAIAADAFWRCCRLYKQRWGCPPSFREPKWQIRPRGLPR